MRTLVTLVVLAGCRIGFDPEPGGVGRCADAHEPNDTIATATPIAIGATITASLCPGDVDVYAVTLTGGDELSATVTPEGPGWPTITLRGADAIRTVETLEPTSSMFADRDGVFYIVVGGVASADATPYQLDVALRAGPHYFVSPTGSDNNPGTFTQPWQRLDTALAMLAPGDTLVLEDGVYAPSDGALDVNCASAAMNGTATQPIRITALTERRAEVDSDGSRDTAYIHNCAYWTIEGLHLENADKATSGLGMGLQIDKSDHITARRILAAHNNRYANTHMLLVYNSTNVLVEDCEVYDFHRDGIAVGNGSNVTIRRSFAASRGRADVPGGYTSGPSDKGDSGISVSGGASALFENNVDEGNGAFGTDDGYGEDLTDTRVLGNAVLHDDYGYLSSIFDTTPYRNLRTQIADHASIGSTYNGFYLRSTEQSTCTRCTAIANLGDGWTADVTNTEPRPGSSTCTDCLALDNTHRGFDISNQPGGWTIAGADAFGNGTDYQPMSDPNLVSSSQLDPQLGGCLIYAPTGSPMRGLGAGGHDVGAQIVYRYRDGVLSDTPLWHPITGVFPCGAVVPGVNDDPTTSCIGIHQRLHVGTPDCALPFPAP